MSGVLPRRATPRLVAFAFAAALLGAAPARCPAAPPAVVFESEVCDLGAVVQGEQPECRFPFANAGAGDLRILEVEPTCGCTTALPDAPLLAPGGRGNIRVVFDSENFAGEVVKEILVRTDDPARPTVRLLVKALVEPEIDLEPATVTFDAAGNTEAQQQVVALTNRRADASRVLRLEARPASFGCRLPAWTDAAAPLVLESWDRALLQVRFSPPATFVMPLAGECLLEIEGPRKRIFRLKLLALPAR